MKEISHGTYSHHHLGRSAALMVSTLLYRCSCSAAVYYVAAEMHCCSRTTTAASCCDGTLLRSCAVGHRALLELEVTPPSRIPPLFGESASNRQHFASFSNIHGVWSARSQSFGIESQPLLYILRPSRKSATVQATGVAPCTDYD